MSTAIPKGKIVAHLSSTMKVETTTPQGTGNVDRSFSNYHCGLIALAVLILVSNLFAIQLYKRHDKIRRNFSNVLLLSLAISDLIVGLIVLPLLIVCEREHLQFGTNTLLRYTCRFNYLIGNLCGFSTIFHIIALTVEKYMAVLHPFQRLNLSTREMYKKILITVWLTALLFASVPLAWMYSAKGQTWHKHYHNYGILQLVVFFGLSVVILTYCYFRMFVKIHAKLSETSQTGRIQVCVRNDRKTVVVFVLFFVIFLIGWFPWFFLALNSHHLIRSAEVTDFLTSLRFAGAFLNPLLYALLKNDYRQAIKWDLNRFCYRYPKQMRFHSPARHSVSYRSNNNNNNDHRTSTTTTTGTGIRLQKVEKLYHNRPPAGSLTSGSPSTHAEDTDF